MKKLLSIFVLMFAIATISAQMLLRNSEPQMMQATTQNIEVAAVQVAEPMQLQRVAMENLETATQDYSEKMNVLQKQLVETATVQPIEVRGTRNVPRFGQGSMIATTYATQQDRPNRAPIPGDVVLEMTFEGTTGTSAAGTNMPAGWTRLGANVGTDANWHTSAAENIGFVLSPNTGTRLARVLGSGFFGQNFASDAWLISPNMALEEGRTYRITFYAIIFANAPLADNQPHFRVNVGQGNTAIAMQEGEEIFNRTEGSTNFNTWVRFVEYFEAPSTGNFNLGFNKYTPGGRVNFVALDDIRVETLETLRENDMAVTAPARAFPYTRIPVGTMTQTITWTPNVTVANVGAEAQTGVNVYVYLGDEQLDYETFASIAAGESEVNVFSAQQFDFYDLEIGASRAITFRVEQAETDDDPTDNEVTIQSPIGTFATMSQHNTPAAFSLNLAQWGTAGNIFTITEAVYIGAVEIGFAAVTGTPMIFIDLAKIEDDGTIYLGAGLDQALIAEAFNRPSAAGDHVFTLPRTRLEPGRYFLGVTQSVETSVGLRSDNRDHGRHGTFSVGAPGAPGYFTLEDFNPIVGPAHISLVFSPDVCPEPTNLATADVTPHLVSFTWDQATDNYLLRVYGGNTVGENFMWETTTSNNFVNEFGRLEPGTTLSWTVTGVCGGGEMSNAVTGPIVTTLLCDGPPFALATDNAFEQDFAGLLFPPQCWDETRTNSAAGFARATVAGRGFAAQFSAMAAGTSMLITEAIEIPAVGVYNLNFGTRLSVLPNTRTAVLISITDTDPASFEELYDFTDLNIGTSGAWGSWTEMSISLEDFQGETVYLAFTHTAVVGEAWVQIENISIEYFPVGITSTTPYDGEINVLLDENIEVVFNQTITQGANFGDIAVTPVLAGFNAEIVDGTTLVITHNGLVPVAQHTVTIPAGAITGFDGATWQFTTTSAELAVITTTPADNAVGVSIDVNLVVTFNQYVDFANGFAGIEIAYTGGTVAVTNATTATRYLTITHAGFDLETEYTVTIPAGTIDGYDEVITWSFTTRGSGLALPFFEGFEGTSAGSIPDEWIRTGTDPTGDPATTIGAWMSVDATQTNVTPPVSPRGGERMMRVRTWQAAEATDAWLFTPALSLVEGVEVEISFAVTRPLVGLAADAFKVQIGTTTDVEGIGVAGTMVDGYTLYTLPGSTAWTIITRRYTPSTTGAHYLGFHVFSPTGAFGVFVDNVSVTEVFDNDLRLSLERVPPALTQVPISQINLPVSFAEIRNVGHETQTDIEMSVTLNGTPLGTSDVHASLMADSVTFLGITETFDPVLGPNTLVFTVTQDETDQYLANNTVTHTIIGTENVFAVDCGVHNTNASNPNTHIGNIFIVSTETQIGAIQVAFMTNLGGATPTPINGVTVSIRPIIDGELGEPLVTSQPFTRPVAAPGWMDIEIPATTLEPGFYFVSVHNPTGVAISVAASFEGTGTVYIPGTGFFTQGFIGIGAHFVRMLEVEAVAIVSTTPANNATNVAVNTPISAIFDTEPMQQGVITSGITITPSRALMAMVSGTNLMISYDGTLAGNTLHTITIAAGTIAGLGEFSWSFTTGEATSIEIPTPTTALVTFYPNPVEDILHIETTETVRQIEIFNLQGALVMTVEGNTTAIDVSNLPAGTFMIRFTTETGISTQRFVKR